LGTPIYLSIAGESWVSAATHYKGFDQFGSVTFHLGAEPLVEALKDRPFEVHYKPAHEAAEKFPSCLDALQTYTAVILSDVGSNSILLHPNVWLRMAIGSFGFKCYPGSLEIKAICLCTFMYSETPAET
jgi:uncharacterized membrane protein